MFETYTQRHNLSVYHAVVRTQITRRIPKYENTSTITTVREDNKLSRQTVQCISKTLILTSLCRRVTIVNYSSHHPNSLLSALFLREHLVFITVAFTTHYKNWVGTLSLKICLETSDFILIMKQETSRTQKCAFFFRLLRNAKS